MKGFLELFEFLVERRLKIEERETKLNVDEEGLEDFVENEGRKT